MELKTELRNVIEVLSTTTHLPQPPPLILKRSAEPTAVSPAVVMESSTPERNVTTVASCPEMAALLSVKANVETELSMEEKNVMMEKLKTPPEPLMVADPDVSLLTAVMESEITENNVITEPKTQMSTETLADLTVVTPAVVMELLILVNNAIPSTTSTVPLTAPPSP
jgi:hypothetical protein